ncbi:hypothetical protein [Halomicrococcus sp. SG-WS-1]|uniref:hypothetical protein n=1 Tax=Halomicrococcus sp. SG-WS-1 TaxID=3439057 RepID=UPI003F7B01E8
MYSVGSGETEDVSNHVTVCWDCMEWGDEKRVARQVQTAGRLKNADPSLTPLYGKAVIRELTERVRLFVYTGRLLFVRRVFIGVVSIIVLFWSSVGLIVFVGTLFLNPDVGFQWAASVVTFAWRNILTTGVTPWATGGLLGVAYAYHVTERERAYERQVQRDRRRRGESPLSYARPRWQFVVVFAVIGVLGATDWLLIRADVFTRGSLIGALVLWTIGATGVAYYLRAALHEDRDVSGMAVTPTPWVVISRGALALGLVGGVATTVGYDSLAPNAITILAICLAPLTGGLYVMHRTVRRRTGWRLQPRAVVHFLRTQLRRRILSRVSTRRHSDETESDATDRETSDRDQQP